jgi:dihydrofolate synthase / folylpolyglutamate synthase
MLSPNASLSHAAALQFLDGRINYERMRSMPCSESAFKLDRMRELLGRLGNPQHGLAIIHVAGTKGKGSTSAMISAILTAAGRRTGLFTSPHIHRIEERIAIDGQPCSDEDFASLVEWIRPTVEAMDREALQRQPAELSPTYFEILTAMAFRHFANRKVDAVVLEVGLGGRLDSTNVCSPCVSVITSISFDHMKQLGATLAAIAAEKAGIIKPGVPVISGVVDAEPRDVIRRVACENGCRLLELGVDFDFDYHARGEEQEARGGEIETPPPTFDFHVIAHNSRRLTASGEHITNSESNSPNDLSNITLKLLGRHQAANAAVALATIAQLQAAGWSIPETAVRRALAEVHCRARIEVVSRRPTVVLDAAHNAASVAALMETLDASFSPARRYLLFATTQEKDIHGMLRLLVGRFDHIFFTRYGNSPRGVPPGELLALVHEMRLPACDTIATTPTVAEAWSAIKKLAAPDDLICIAGSFYLAAEMQDLLPPLSCRTEQTTSGESGGQTFLSVPKGR